MPVLREAIPGTFLILLCATVMAVSASSASPQSSQSTSQSPQPYPVPQEEVQEHETGNHRALHLPRPTWRDIFQAVRLTLVVNESGEVVSATPVEGPSGAFALAVKEARKWKYLPFERDGQPTSAQFDDYVRVLPPEESPKTNEPFPTINDLSGVVMTLSRSRCWGFCPAYSVELHGDGSVIYKGESFVVVTGEHRDHLSPEQVSEILEAFRKADYFSLKDKYSYGVTDQAAYRTSLQIDQLKKAVTDYVGGEAGMPDAVSDLERTIDRVVGTVKWIRGTADTVQALRKEGWDFKSPEAAKVLARAVQERRSALVKDLLAEGVGLTGRNEAGNSALAAAAVEGDAATVKELIKAGAGKNSPDMKTEALAGAAQSGDIQLARFLLDYGGDPKGVIHSDRQFFTVLMAAASSGVPEVVEMILAQHPDVNARDQQGRTALWYIWNQTALSALFMPRAHMHEERHAERAHVLHLLVRAGADVNSQDDHGNALLHTAHWPDVARALIEEGANVNIQDKNGETPLMTTFSLDVAKVLVAAGADVDVLNYQWKTAIDLSRQLEGEGEKTRLLESVSKVKAHN